MTAENRPPRRGEWGPKKASMRPRPMTAENRGPRRWTKTKWSCFNEAAADDRGKPPRSMPPFEGAESFNEAAADDRGKPAGRLAGALGEAGASMRPRPMTAENRARCSATSCRSPRFNEAAADDRGKPARRLHRPGRGGAASMRPRPMTAENRAAAARARVHVAGASMRPRPMTAENRRYGGICCRSGSTLQ